MLRNDPPPTKTVVVEVTDSLGLSDRTLMWFTQNVQLFVSVRPQEKQKMSDKLEDTSLRLKEEMGLYNKMVDKLQQSRQQFHKEKAAMQEVGLNVAHRLCSNTWRPLSTLTRCLCAADGGAAPGAGAPAALQAGGGAARPEPQRLLWALRLQQQEQRGGARAGGQEAPAGTSIRPPPFYMIYTKSVQAGSLRSKVVKPNGISV